VDASDAADASDALDAAASDAADASDASDANDAADVVDAGPADANTSCVVAVFGDYYVRTDGSAVNGVSGSVVLDDANGQPLTGISQIVQETYSACALKSDHTVYCWPTSTSGNNGNGQLGNNAVLPSRAPVAVALGGVVSVAAGARHTCAVTRQGSV